MLSSHAVLSLSYAALGINELEQTCSPSFLKAMYLCIYPTYALFVQNTSIRLKMQALVENEITRCNKKEEEEKYICKCIVYYFG